MAIKASNSSNVRAINIRYSAFLGMSYVSNPANEAILKLCRESVGETEWKRGFKGSRGDSASAVARARLKEDGIVPVTVSGILRGARVIEREVNGRKSPYLNVSLLDETEGERYYISVDLNQDAAQMLARKLVNATPGVLTAISLFGTYEPKPGQDRTYANHAASVRQGDGEVVGVNPREVLGARTRQVEDSLKAAGISDKETINAAKDKSRLDYHLALMVDVNDKFSKFYKDAEQPMTEHSDAGNDEGMANDQPY